MRKKKLISHRFQKKRLLLRDIPTKDDFDAEVKSYRKISLDLILNEMSKSAFHKCV